MQTIELHKMGLVELQLEESEQLNGGNPGWVTWVIQQAIIHSEEIARGIERGWNFDKQTK